MKRQLFMILFLSVLSLACGNVCMAKTADTVKLNKTKVTIKNGKSITLKLKNNKKKIDWSSADKDIAAVNAKGKVTAKHLGTVTITARAGKKNYKCKVTVKTNLDSKKIKVQYKNDIFTKEVLSQLKEFQIPSSRIYVRNKAALKKIFSLFSETKLTEATTLERCFDNTQTGDDLFIWDSLPRIFVLKDKSCVQVEYGETQIRVSKYDSVKKTNCTFQKVYDISGDSSKLHDQILDTAEENKVIYLS